MSQANPETTHQALEAVPGIPRDSEGPVFREPWEAQSFALTLGLYEQGLFSWKEWTAALVEEIKRAQDAGQPDTGEAYYLHWLAALEHIIAEKGVVDDVTLSRYRDAWRRAAMRTPHGEPILLDPGDIED